MSHVWQKPRIFERESNIYTFSHNPLLQKNKFLHIFMPWNEIGEPELMFKIKDQISKEGFVNIPFFKGRGRPCDITSEVLSRLKEQLAQNSETHLIMSNLDSIHVLRVVKVQTYDEVKFANNQIFNYLKGSICDFKFWFKIDDMFVLDANHDKVAGTIEQRLGKFISDSQKQNIFNPAKQVFAKGTEGDKRIKRPKWIESNRSLTYDYFVRSCELKNNIYQDCWSFLGRKTQHELISSDLKRYSGVFFRDDKKWIHLKQSFDHYYHALINELNEVYLFPLVSAISEYSSLNDAWFDLDNSLVNPRVKTMLEDLLIGKKAYIDSLDDFLYYTKSAKSFLFSLKQKFIKKIHKEEFLRVESFLCRQESLIESLICHKIVGRIEAIMHIQLWIGEIDTHVSYLQTSDLNNCNLKLSHLLSIMSSASYEDNIFFKLIEEKSSRGVSKNTFEEQVKDLLSIDFKETA